MATRAAVPCALPKAPRMPVCSLSAPAHESILLMRSTWNGCTCADVATDLEVRDSAEGKACNKVVAPSAVGSCGRSGGGRKPLTCCSVPAAENGQSYRSCAVGGKACRERHACTLRCERQRSAVRGMHVRCAPAHAGGRCPCRRSLPCTCWPRSDPPPGTPMRAALFPSCTQMIDEASTPPPRSMPTTMGPTAAATTCASTERQHQQCGANLFASD